MKPVNIFALTRVNNLKLVSRLERQMSSRRRFLHVKQWELVSLGAFVDRLTETYKEAASFNFYFSFQIPKLGKEFDLLRISDDLIINVELKSFPVTDDAIRKQLIQNRYYLSTLGKTIRSYTYISSEDRLVRLTNSEKLLDVDFDILKEDLIKQQSCYENDIEELFIEERYIISPLASPDRFLKNEYFLTSQQVDIKKHILKNIRNNTGDDLCVQGFTGLPGTGKTLLLYDIAMELSKKQRVCIIHCGSFSEELNKLDERLKRIDFFQCNSEGSFNKEDLSDYTAYLVDEAHLLKEDVLSMIIESARFTKTPVIFSYDNENTVCESEFDRAVIKKMEALNGYVSYRLTNRIRTKSELSSYIQAIIQGTRNNHRKEFPSVSLSYADNKDDTISILECFTKQGFTYIKDDLTVLNESFTGEGSFQNAVDVSDVSFKEFDKVVMIVDNRFYYDDNRYLRTHSPDMHAGAVQDTDIGDDKGSAVRNLFHGLNRAKSRIALIVFDNEPVFEGFLGIAQGFKV